MASPTIYKLSPERRETVDRFGDTSHEVNRGNTDPGPNKGPSKFPPPTHDTSRIGWHMKDLECFAKSIETAVSSSFPNHGGSRYRSVNVSMMRWARDDLGVAQELDALVSVFQDEYGFNVEEWKIPADKKSHTNLMQKALDFLDDYDSEDNLFILYYAGHGFINQDRQSTWACSQDASSPTVDWSHIQGLFERAKSDVLVLLDCCAAVSLAPRGRDTLMETIAACGFESRAPPPGEHSFTTSLIEVLHDWSNAPSFSVTMLHSEVLRVLMRRRKERCRNGQKVEWRSTPVHMNNFTHGRTIGIELCKRGLIDTDSSLSIRSSQPIEELLQPDIGLTSNTYLDLMSLSCEALEERLDIKYETREPSTEIMASSTLTSDLSGEVTSKLKIPHMLISITLDEDQPLPNPEACRRWICAFPGLARHVKIEGIFSSYSTVIILSIPVVIWNMLPDNPACQPISYVTSRNLIVDPRSNFLRSERSLATEYIQSQSSMGKNNISNTSFTTQSVSGFAGPVDLQPTNSTQTQIFESFARGDKAISETHQLESTSSQNTPICETRERSKSDTRLHRPRSTVAAENGTNKIREPHNSVNDSPQARSTPVTETATDGLLSHGSPWRTQWDGRSPSTCQYIRELWTILTLGGPFKVQVEKSWKALCVSLARGKKRNPDLEALDEDSASKSNEENPWPQYHLEIYRSFRLSHFRVLTELQIEIQMLEQDLLLQDQSQAAMKKWPKGFKEERDGCTKALIEQLREKLLVYDDLLLNHAKLQGLEQSGGKNQVSHLNLFNRIIKEKNINDFRQFNEIYHYNDFVPLVPWSWIQQLEYSIITVLEILFPKVKAQPTLPVGYPNHFYSKQNRFVITMARLFTLLLVVGTLMFPVFIMIWIPMTGYWMPTLISASILLFCILTSVLTNAKPQKLVIGTATYAAILLTFYGNMRVITQMG